MDSGILKGMIALVNKLPQLTEEEECRALKLLGDFMEMDERNRSEIIKVAEFVEMLIEKFDKIDISKPENEEMLINLMYILEQVAYEDESFVEKLFPEDNAMIQKMFMLMNHQNLKVFNPAVQVFTHLIIGIDGSNQTKRVLDLGIISLFPSVLVKHGADIYSILVMLVNLATLKEGVQEITDVGLLEFVADYAKEGNSKVKRECVDLLNNMVCVGSHDDHDVMIGKGILSILDGLKRVYHGNTKMTDRIQKALDRLRLPRNHRYNVHFHGF